MCDCDNISSGFYLFLNGAIGGAIALTTIIAVRFIRRLIADEDPIELPDREVLIKWGIFGAVGYLLFGGLTGVATYIVGDLNLEPRQAVTMGMFCSIALPLIMGYFEDVLDKSSSKKGANQISSLVPPSST